MEKRIKKRMALLGVLLLAGLLMAAAGSAVGARTILGEKPDVIRAVPTGNNVDIYRDGTIINQFTLPEGTDTCNTWNMTSDDGTIIGSVVSGACGELTQEQIEIEQAKQEIVLNKVLEIAMKDARVQELIAGKKYEIIGMGASGESDKNSSIPPIPRIEIENMNYATLTIEIEGKAYDIEVDIKNKKVDSVKESSFGAEGTIGEINGIPTKEQIEVDRAKYETELNKVLEIAMKDARVQELIAGKNNEIMGISPSEPAPSASENWNMNYATLTIEVEGKYYDIAVDMKNKKVDSVKESSIGENNQHEGGVGGIR